MKDSEMKESGCLSVNGIPEVFCSQCGFHDTHCLDMNTNYRRIGNNIEKKDKQGIWRKFL